MMICRPRYRPRHSPAHAAFCAISGQAIKLYRHGLRHTDKPADRTARDYQQLRSSLHQSATLSRSPVRTLIAARSVVDYAPISRTSSYSLRHRRNKYYRSVALPMPLSRQITALRIAPRRAPIIHAGLLYSAAYQPGQERLSALCSTAACAAAYAAFQPRWAR